MQAEQYTANLAGEQFNEIHNNYFDFDSFTESPCDSQPCRNKGKCEIVGNDFKCECRPNFRGKRCQISSSKDNDLFNLPVRIINNYSNSNSATRLTNSIFKPR